MVKALNSMEFFHTFHRVVGKTDVQGDRRRWRVVDVEFCHDRQSHWGRDYSFNLDIYMAEDIGGAWKIVVVRETWWGSDRNVPIRSSEWAKLAQGESSAAIAWFNRYLE